MLVFGIKYISFIGILFVFFLSIHGYLNPGRIYDTPDMIIPMISFYGAIFFGFLIIFWLWFGSPIYLKSFFIALIIFMFFEGFHKYSKLIDRRAEGKEYAEYVKLNGARRKFVNDIWELIDEPDAVIEKINSASKDNPFNPDANYGHVPDGFVHERAALYLALSFDDPSFFESYQAENGKRHFEKREKSINIILRHLDLKTEKDYLNILSFMDKCDLDRLNPTCLPYPHYVDSKIDYSKRFTFDYFVSQHYYEAALIRLDLHDSLYPYAVESNLKITERITDNDTRKQAVAIILQKASVFVKEYRESDYSQGVDEDWLRQYE